MKRWKKFAAVMATLSTLLVMMLSAIAVQASVEDAGLVVDGSILTTESEAQDTWQNLTKGNFLNGGSVKLGDAGNRYVSVYGNTTCFITCDTVYCYLYLEQYNSNTGAWNSYKSWNYTADDTYKLTKSFSYKVAGGHYYRLRGWHAAKENGVTESASTRTNGIWIA